MSIFGSNKKTYYNSTSTKLFEDTPPIINQTVISAITQNRNIAADLIGNLSNGIYFNTTRLRNWAKNTDVYPWGLPNGTRSLISPQVATYVTEVIKLEIGSPVLLSFTILERDADTVNIMYRAEYFILDNNGVATTTEPYIWEYDESSGVYPLLTLDEVDKLEESPYYPIIPLRENGVYLAARPAEGVAASPERIAIKQACRMIQLEPDDINDAIEADPSYENNATEDAFIVFGVDVTSTDDVSREYMYNFFLHQHGLNSKTQENYEDWYSNNRFAVPPINLISMEDSNYKMELGWFYTSLKLVTGRLTNAAGEDAPVNYHDSEIVLGGEQQVYTTGYSYSLDILILRKQVSLTQYSELAIVGLTHANWAVGKELRTTLTDAVDGVDEVSQAFFIPVRQDLLKIMGGVKTHDLMYKAIRLVLNDKFVQKLKWYQTGFFQAIILVIGVVLTFFYPPLGVALTGLALVGFSILYVLAMRLLMPVVFSALEDIFGEKLALLVSVLAIAFGVGFSTESLVTVSGASVISVASAAVVAVGGLASLEFADELASINKELEEYTELLEDVFEEQAETAYNVSVAVGMSSSDSYAIMDTDKYVSRFQLESRKETLIGDTTTYFTDIMRFVDKPDSYIRLGHTGY